MRTISNYWLYLLIITCGACLPEENFKMPEYAPEETDIVPNSDIRSILESLEQSGEDLYTFGENENTIAAGFVVSSDAGGNFYKTLVLQDAPQNPGYGIAVRLENRAYHTKYSIGRKLFLILAGLSIAREKGSYYLGYRTLDRVGEIPASMIDSHLIRSEETATVVPELITMEEVDDQRLNTLVQMKELQFAKGELGRTFAGERFDAYNGERILEQCDNRNSIMVQTSTFSDFRSNLLPEGRFTLSGILTKDYYSERFSIVLNDPEQIRLTGGERCDPEYLHCGTGNLPGQHVIYLENFQELQNTSQLVSLGWINQNVLLGNGIFRKRSSGENTFLRISAYESGESLMDVWLISPEIDLDQSEEERLSFQTRATFAEGQVLSVWISNDFQGDIENAEWKLLDVRISGGSRDGSNEEFTHSGWTELHCLSGKIRIAFRYQGSDPGYTTTYDVDNVLIMGESSNTDHSLMANQLED